jgi:hypothetical protein
VVAVGDQQRVRPGHLQEGVLRGARTDEPHAVPTSARVDQRHGGLVVELGVQQRGQLVARGDRHEHRGARGDAEPGEHAGAFGHHVGVHLLAVPDPAEPVGVDRGRVDHAQQSARRPVRTVHPVRRDHVGDRPVRLAQQLRERFAGDRQRLHQPRPRGQRGGRAVRVLHGEQRAPATAGTGQGADHPVRLGELVHVRTGHAVAHDPSAPHRLKPSRHPGTVLRPPIPSSDVK